MENLIHAEDQVVDGTCHDNIFLPPSCNFFSWNHPAAALFHAGAAQNVLSDNTGELCCHLTLFLKLFPLISQRHHSSAFFPAVCSCALVFQLEN